MWQRLHTANWSAALVAGFRIDREVAVQQLHCCEVGREGCWMGGTELGPARGHGSAPPKPDEDPWLLDEEGPSACQSPDGAVSSCCLPEATGEEDL